MSSVELPYCITLPSQRTQMHNKYTLYASIFYIEDSEYTYPVSRALLKKPTSIFSGNALIKLALLFKDLTSLMKIKVQYLIIKRGAGRGGGTAAFRTTKKLW